MSRVIYITVRTPLGITEEFIIPEMVELTQRMHELLIVPRSPSGSRVKQAEAIDLQPFCIYQPLLSWPILLDSLQVLALNFKKCLSLLLRIILGSGNILNLLKNLAVFPKGLWLAQLAKRWRADHLHAHWALSTATMGMIAGEVSGIPWSFTAHRGDIVDNNMLDVKVQRATFVRFISEGGVRLAQPIIKKKLPIKCHVIHMGVKLPDKVSPRKINNGKPFTIMCPANLLPVKGHAYLLQSVKKLKERGVFCQLLLAGKGPLASNLHLLVEELDIRDRVRFLGRLSHNELLKYYENDLVGLVVLPSIDLGNGHHEGIPVSLMEAMAYAIPVIATETGSIPELINEGTGILVPPQDSKKLAEAIERLIGDADLRFKLGIAGRQRVKDAFNVVTVTQRLCQLIAEQDRP